MSPATLTGAMIEAQGLTKRYGTLVAVNDLSFTIEPGETFALIGPNGAGKTTTLKLLLGLVRPDRGTIGIGAERLRPHDARARHHLGYVPQVVEFPVGRTVREVLEFFAALRGLPVTAVDRAIARVGLAPYSARRASELSGGYTQRLSLAQALLGDPSLLVLDEPTASLDPEASWEFRALVQQLQAERVTILLCSHLLAEVERIADRVMILNGGTCAAVERLDALRSRQATASRLVVELAAAERAGAAADALEKAGFDVERSGGPRLLLHAAAGRGATALDILAREGLEVRGFEIERPTLEDLFMDVVRKARR